MKNFDIMKLDSKGRVLIPYHIREYLDLKEDSEFIIINNEKRELKILPLMKGNNAHVRVVIDDSRGSLAKVLDVIAENRVNILMSNSKTIEHGQIAEWNAIVDITSSRNLKKIEQDLRRLKVVKKVEIEER